ncbi:putative toxin-antitoxin system toxin component, PIN family [Desulfovibrio sp. OttesenSCG-928-F20]|nr:putative toxin-antitoxin system toxin component, PIN family [Desulfovibrio sp. OttesenSCG-928-F20]
MRIMLDTNVLISAFVFESKHISDMIDVLTEGHTIVLPSYVIEELKRVVAEKFSHKYGALNRFLTNLPFEFVYTPENIDKNKYPTLRDIDDVPVLATAIIEDVDVLLTGDKDFENLGLKRPAILTPSHFLQLYGR